MFHRWDEGVKYEAVDKSNLKKGWEKVRCTVAIIEFEDGTIKEVTDIESLKFTDREVK